MFRKLSTEEEEKPSLIQEIVIYDKPNKPEVPEAILPQSAQIDYGKGDIILSRSIVPKPIPVKKEPIYDETAERPRGYKEPSVDTLNEIIHEYLEEGEPSEEEEESIENISKEVMKSAETITKLPKPAVCQPSTPTVFKKPRGRPRKSDSTNTPQKSTILNYFNKVPDTMEVIIDNGAGSGKSPRVEEGRQKRVRRIPKKYDDDILDERSMGRYSRSDTSSPPLASPLKKKKFTELQIVPIYAPNEASAVDIDTEQIDNLLNETDDQLRTLTEAVQRGQKPSRKSRRLSSLKTETDEDTDASSVVGHNDDYADSDEDSRCEWIPEEYAEYKRQHTIKSGKMYKCKFCSLEFGSYYALRKHRALAHDDLVKERKESSFDEGEGSPNAEEDQIDCSDEESSRGEWMPEDYAEYKVKHNLNKQKRVQWYKCKICCAVFPNYYKLAKHRVEHDQTEPYKCKNCDASFNDVDTFTAHLRVHQGKDPYTCRKCDKGFQTKKELVDHEPTHVLKKGPEPEKKYRCEVCSKEFRKLCDIERHTRVHTGEKPAECNICHKRFQQTHNLSKHLLTHLHVRPFQCEICHKKFGRVDVLNRHLLTHSVEKPYKCVLCNKGFIRQVQVTNHMEKHHSDTAEEIADEVLIASVG